MRPSLLELSHEDLDRLSPTAAWTMGDFVAAACLLEASAPKAGNVHPAASFVDMDYEDFRRSAVVVGEVFDESIYLGCGQLIHAAIQATLDSVGKNTNLGMVLLLAPLAKSFDAADWPRSIQRLLESLTDEDALFIYRAIAMAKPGGLGHVDRMDIDGVAPPNVLDAMRLASEWDDIAAAYTTSFAEIFNLSKQLDRYRQTENRGWHHALIIVQGERLASHGDSLIARKNDRGLSQEVMQRADAICRSGILLSERWHLHPAWLAFDAFLRADGHRRNPGTTADLLAAATLVSLLRQTRSQKING